MRLWIYIWAYMYVYHQWLVLDGFSLVFLVIWALSSVDPAASSLPWPAATCEPRMGPRKLAKEKAASDTPCMLPCRLRGRCVVYNALAGVRIRGAGTTAST